MLNRKSKEPEPVPRFGMKFKPSLAERLKSAVTDANEYLDLLAQEQHASCPEVPKETIRISLLRRQHPIDACLRLLAEGDQ